jgi:hypothetical protein
LPTYVPAYSATIPRAMQVGRRSRPTLRCLVVDLGIALPGLDVDLGSLEHPLMTELRRIAPTSPLGQKRILSIANPLVYRIRVSWLRGATWVDEAPAIVWLCAVGGREDGSDDDAYTWFLELHARGELLPSDDDRLRDRAEAAIRLQRGLTRDLLELVNESLATPGRELHAALGGFVPCRALVIQGADSQEVWCALGTRGSDGTFLKPQIRDLLFAALEAHLSPALFEIRGDWPTGPVDWAEIVKLAIR